MALQRYAPVLCRMFNPPSDAGRLPRMCVSCGNRPAVTLPEMPTLREWHHRFFCSVSCALIYATFKAIQDAVAQAHPN